MENYISLNIRYLREKQGVSQKSLTDLLGKKNSSSVGHYESGKSIPPVDELVKLCNFFSVSINDIILTDLKSKHDLKSNENVVQIADNHGISSPSSAMEVEFLRKTLVDKDREIEFLRKIIEKKM